MTLRLPKSWVLWAATISTAFAGAGCNPPKTDSQAQDIFTQDTDGIRRRKAAGDELLWTIDMGGCTGHLISPDYMMTAAHCSPRAGASYRSGASIQSGGRSDITVEQVVESDRQLDYAIMKIRWNGQRPANQKFPPRVATQASDLKMGTRDGDGEIIFTVGFPGDTRSSWGATYAEGEAKRAYGSLLQYNIGIINGNSGGGVWRKSDGMLVSLTNGGPSMLGQPGWQGNDKNDSSHWNHGAAMWNVYSRSRTLQDIFPNGQNRFAADTDSTDPGSQNNAGGRLYLAIGDESPAAADTYKMVVSAAATVAKVVLCQGQAPCQPGAAGYTSTAEDGTKAGRKLHKTTTPIALTPGAVWTLTALDAAGQPIGSESIRFDRNP